MTQEEVIASLEREIVIASAGVVSQAVKLALTKIHDGTGMVVVPQEIFDRLERAIQLRTDYGQPGANQEK